MDQDPFPLFHLSDLTYEVDASSIAKLASWQLALAPFTADWDESLQNRITKTWRQRREKFRQQVGVAPMGVFAGEEKGVPDPQFPPPSPPPSPQWYLPLLFLLTSLPQR